MTRTKYYCNQDCYYKNYTEWKKEFYKNKYHIDLEFRKKTLKRSKQYHKNNPHILKKIWLNRKKRMESDPKYKKARKEYEKKYLEFCHSNKNISLKRPSHWGGYVIRPDYFEFWTGNEHRLNKREVYEKKYNGWKKYFLEP